MEEIVLEDKVHWKSILVKLEEIMYGENGIETIESTFATTPETSEEILLVNFLFVKTNEKSITKNRSVINP